MFKSLQKIEDLSGTLRVLAKRYSRLSSCLFIFLTNKLRENGHRAEFIVDSDDRNRGYYSRPRTFKEHSEIWGHINRLAALGQEPKEEIVGRFIGNKDPELSFCLLQLKAREPSDSVFPMVINVLPPSLVFNRIFWSYEIGFRAETRDVLRSFSGMSNRHLPKVIKSIIDLYEIISFSVGGQPDRPWSPRELARIQKYEGEMFQVGHKIAEARNIDYLQIYQDGMEVLSLIREILSNYLKEGFPTNWGVSGPYLDTITQGVSFQLDLGIHRTQRRLTTLSFEDGGIRASRSYDSVNNPLLPFYNELYKRDMNGLKGLIHNLVKEECEKTVDRALKAMDTIHGMVDAK